MQEDAKCDFIKDCFSLAFKNHTSICNFDNTNILG